MGTKETKTLRVPAHLHDEAERLLDLDLDLSRVPELRAMASVAAPDLLRAAIVHGLEAIMQIGLEDFGADHLMTHYWQAMEGSLEESRPSKRVDMIPFADGQNVWEAVLQPGERIRHLVFLWQGADFHIRSTIDVCLLRLGDGRWEEEAVLVKPESNTPALYFRESPNAESPILQPYTAQRLTLVRARITPPPSWRNPPRIQLIIERCEEDTTACGPLLLQADLTLPVGAPPAPGLHLDVSRLHLSSDVISALGRTSFSDGQIWDLEHTPQGEVLLGKPHDPGCPACKDPL